MLKNCEDVVKYMTFDVNTPIDTVSMTLRNWEISIPQISTPTRKIIISTWLTIILTNMSIQDRTYIMEPERYS